MTAESSLMSANRRAC